MQITLNKRLLLGVAIGVFLGGSLLASVAHAQDDSTSVEPVACTQEVRICPDGSHVGRTGPNCEFTRCSDTKPRGDLGGFFRRLIPGGGGSTDVDDGNGVIFGRRGTVVPGEIPPRNYAECLERGGKELTETTVTGDETVQVRMCVWEVRSVKYICTEGVEGCQTDTAVPPAQRMAPFTKGTDTADGVRSDGRDGSREDRAEQRETRRAELTDKIKDRIRAYAGRIITRFEAAIARIEKMTGRIDSRIQKFEDEKEFDLSEAKNLLTEARGHLDNARTSVSNAEAQIGDAIAADNPKEAFEGVRTILGSAKQSIKDAHGALVKSIRAIKAGAGLEEPSTEEGGVEDGSSNNDSDEE